MSLQQKKVIWQGNSKLQFAPIPETGKPGPTCWTEEPSGTYRAVWEPRYKTLEFEEADGRDAMGVVRWRPITGVPEEFLFHASKLMSEQVVE